MALRRKQPQAIVIETQGLDKIDESSLINPELIRFTNQVNEILAAMESINLLKIEDIDERLKSTKTKLEIGLKLPILLGALDDLRNKAKLKAEDVKGNKNISLLESGALI